jgi:hypothetical protein
MKPTSSAIRITPLAAAFFLQRRPGLLPPGLDPGFIALTCPPRRLLMREIHLLEDHADVVVVIADAKFTLDQIGDQLLGPKIPVKPALVWLQQQHLRQTLALLKAQPRRPSAGLA